MCVAQRLQESLYSEVIQVKFRVAPKPGEEPLDPVHLVLDRHNRISLSLDQINVGVEVFSPLLGLGIYRREMLFFNPATMASGMLQGYAESLICICMRVKTTGAAFGIFRNSA
jgi:hypothetical protein